ncbi:toprim domain-containing protein [Bradyrhizobium sp.]|jgi:hypothetical protein|uniref:toprim domain-containing protein n=1 Tax=Bradyrhizobium sp. TaxID=376 RepID=UPI002B8A9DBC|nr:hypothetical protein [Bradyrhizobium sp.]HWX57219.1 hypothetical protein [Bradyrhizobium sp.]
MISFDQLKALNCDHRAVADAPCPSCGPECRSEANRRRKVLRIWDDGDFITYKCARCDISGWARADSGSARPAAPRPTPSPEPERDKAQLARFLWSQSVPLPGTLAETYLHSRKCFIASPNLRFLPGRNGHAPAMIARFGAEDLTGVHLTKLRADGAGKAGTENDKIIIGPSLGQPIILQDNLEREELAIAEGIEDAASLASVTGWSAWAAGTANRIPPVLAGAGTFPKVYCAVDLDFGKKERVRAGPKALNKSRAIRADIIPLKIEKVLGFKDKLDANRALIQYGPEVLLAAIEWCEAQERFARGEIGIHAMQRAIARVDSLFAGLSEP